MTAVAAIVVVIVFGVIFLQLVDRNAVLDILREVDAGDLIAAGVILFRLAMWLLPVLTGWPVTLRWQTTSGTSLFGGGATAA